MKRFWQYFPWIVVSLGALYLIGAMWMPSDRQGQLRIGDFSSLPVVDGGRVKPFDTLARTSLMIISGRQTYREEIPNTEPVETRTQPATKWLLDVMTSSPYFRNEAAFKHKVFRIENDQVLNLLSLKPRPGFRYALDEFFDKEALLNKEANRAKHLDPKQRDVFDVKVLELRQHLELYLMLAQMLSPYSVPPLAPGEEWKPLIQAIKDAQAPGASNPAAHAMAQMLLFYSDNQTENFNKLEAAYRERLQEQMPAEMNGAKFEVFFNHFAPFDWCARLYVVVLLLALISWLGWMAQDLRQMLGKMIYGVVCFATLLSFTGTVLGGIWADQSWGRFWGWDPKENGALIIVLWNALILHARWAGLVKLRGLALLAIGGNIVTAWSWFGVNMLGVGLHSYGFMSGALFWLLFFAFSQLVIIGLGLLPLGSWEKRLKTNQWSQALNRAAFWLAVLTLVVHTWALGARIYLQGRPPVTNLYSSAVFIGWGCVILGLFLEWIYKNGIGTVVAAVLGGLTLIIAHNLATSGDTLEMMQAVLDTNFWLATHVTCVTLGYTATFLAGFLGILYVFITVGKALMAWVAQQSAAPPSELLVSSK